MSKKPARSPGLVFGAFAVLLLVIVAAAFTTQQPPPPPTAEFAPEAAKAIKAPPPNQTSSVGNQGNTGGRGGASGPKRSTPTPTPTPSGPTVGSGAPATKDCIGDPPRQTEDPESPPCVAYFKGNNGGATAPGVTKDTIKIALAGSPNNDVATALISFFNKRFEFYGRQLVVVPGHCGEGSPAKLVSEADSFAQQGVFAVLGCGDTKSSEAPFYDELARKGVVSVADHPNLMTESHFTQFHPYEWTFWSTYDQGQKLIADIVCKLKGQNAAHAGAAYINTTRKFGLIYNTFSDEPDPDMSAIKDAMTACGISYDVGHVALEHSSAQQGYSQNTEQQALSVLTQFKNDGVTTVIDMVHAITLEQITQVAASMSYEPEHVISSYLYNADGELGISGLPQDQTAHMVGATTYNPHIAPQQEYWYQAVMEGNPNFQWTDPSKYNVSATIYTSAWYLYYPLLVLSAGIQNAGPNLTPARFATGLQNAQYPNPVIPGHPEGLVTIQPGQHSYISDQSLLWFVPGQPDPSYGNPSSYCYAFLCRRFPLGQAPTADPFGGSVPCRRHGS
jgi:hypothetical protein